MVALSNRWRNRGIGSALLGELELRLDSAFFRPGRFDYIIPIGPPDATARTAIWGRYLGPTADSVDVGRLVEASEMFTPAEHRIRRAQERTVGL